VLALPHDEVQDNAQVWEYTVLATNATYDIAAIGQLYRDRCDCENGFDELKNQWGWGGFTTQDMHRSQVTARAWPWSTTGGAGTCARPTRRPDARR
jgi:hypothetical protein